MLVTGVDVALAESWATLAGTGVVDTEMGMVTGVVVGIADRPAAFSASCDMEPS